MPHCVATLIAAPSTFLPTSTCAALVEALRSQGGQDVTLQEHASSQATDIFCQGLAPSAIYDVARGYLADRPVDVIVQPVAKRRKKLLLADMESTIIEQEMLDELAAMLGLRDKVAAITRRAMNGELDFAESLKERSALLAGQPESMLEKVAALITPMPGAAALVASMKAHGAQCWLATGGFTCFAEIVAKRLGFDRAYANELTVEQGVITGAVREPILDKRSKQATLEQACGELGLALDECLTVGDGANDVPMLTAANQGGGLGIAYHAKPAVRAVIPHQINHGDLTALVYAQGLEP